jgi:hypothetical protein
MYREKNGRKSTFDALQLFLYRRAKETYGEIERERERERDEETLGCNMIGGKMFETLAQRITIQEIDASKKKRGGNWWYTTDVLRIGLLLPY